MKRLVVLFALAALCGALIAGCGKQTNQGGNNAASNQSSAGSQPGGGGAMGGQFAQFREAHKFTFQLTSMVGNIAQLDTDGVAPLTPAQAKTMLGILTPLRTKASLTQDEAKETLKALKQVLTEQQLTEIGKMKPRRSTRGGQGQGMRGSGGHRPNFDPNAMKDFNPFNPKGGAPTAQQSQQRWNTFFAALGKKAKSAK